MAKYKIYRIPDYVYPDGSIGKVGITADDINVRMTNNQSTSIKPFNFWEILEEHDITATEILFSKCINRREDQPGHLCKYIIPKELKSDFVLKLKEKNITKESLLPDKRILDKISKDFNRFVNQLIHKFKD